MKYDAVVFDMDGTVLNSLPEITRVVNSVISDIGMTGKSETEIKNAVGYGIEHLLRTIGVPLEWVETFAEEVGSRYARPEGSAARLFPGIEEILEVVKEKGMKYAILSNRPTEGLKRAVEHFLPAVEFSSVLGSSPGKPAKPSPDTLNEIVRIMNVKPERVLMVGDGEPDILAAIAAGVEHLAVKWGYTSTENLEKVGAVNFAESAEEVLKFILSKE